MAALATLTTQGRAVGYCVVAALQDPRKDVLTIRNLLRRGRPGRLPARLGRAGRPPGRRRSRGPGLGDAPVAGGGRGLPRPGRGDQVGRGLVHRSASPRWSSRGRSARAARPG